MDRATVCGLLTQYGGLARGRDYEHRWERDAAVWRAVLDALKDAASGVRPATPCQRPPAWLAAAVRRRLQTMARQWSHDSVFGAIRTLERLGLVDLEPDETYVLAAVGGIGDRFTPSRAATLRNDPELIDRVVWRMFEVEGGGEVSLANVDKFSADEAGWRAAFAELTADGTLPRHRVLTSCLGALNRDFSAYRAGWYARLYDALEPTVEEIAGHQVELRALLRSTVAATVGFAVQKLRHVHKRGLLDHAATLPALSAAVVAAPKGTAVAAVRLARAVAQDAPELGPDAADVAAAALGHPHADVQRAAVALLAQVGETDRLGPAESLLEPSVRADMLGRRQPAAADVAPPRRAAEPALPADGDLVERLAALLEVDGDPLEVEFVLAGLAQLGDRARLGPLVRRAAAVHGRGVRDGRTATLRGATARLVLAADGTDLPPLARPTSPAVAFLVQRLAAVEEVLRGVRPPRPLLATPDDPWGWVAPATLVDRLERHGEPDRYDLVAALLRVHPDGRDLALGRAATLGGPAGDVVRYALGAPAPRRSRRLLRSTPSLGDPAWWVAASRARSPVDPDPWLAAQGIAGAGRSQPIEGRVVFSARPYSWSDRTGVHTSTHWDWEIAVADANKKSDDREPTAVAGAHGGLGGADLEGFVGWLATIYPHDCEHFLVTTLDAVLRAATGTEVSRDAVRVLDAIGRHPGRLGPLTLTALAAGLTAGKVDQRAHAVDAVLHQHGRGRLSAEQLAEGLGAVAGPATPTRLATAMRDMAASDHHAADLVIDALAGALPSFDRSSRGLHALLAVLREELLRRGRPTPERLRPWLEGFTGTSRASRTAAALLVTP